MAQAIKSPFELGNMSPTKIAIRLTKSYALQGTPSEQPSPPVQQFWSPALRLGKPRVGLSHPNRNAHPILRSALVDPVENIDKVLKHFSRTGFVSDIQQSRSQQLASWVRALVSVYDRTHLGTSSTIREGGRNCSN